MTSEVEVMPQVITPSALEVMEKATIDTQIATAHQYPRSLETFKKRATEMVTLDEETAQSCIYRRPVGKEGGKMKYAEGKSVRMAEIVAASYGNIRVGAIIVEQTERMVKCRGFAHDLETNFAFSSEVIESTVNNQGKPYSERMRIVVAKAALSKARRDATFVVIPGALCKKLEDAARKTAIGNETTLGKRRLLVMDWVNKIGAEPKRVFAALGIKGEDDLGLNELETLTGLKTAIMDKEVTIDEAFPPVDINEPERKSDQKKNGKKKTEKKVTESDEEKLIAEAKELEGKVSDEAYIKAREEVGLDNAEAIEMVDLGKIQEYVSLLKASV